MLIETLALVGAGYYLLRKTPPQQTKDDKLLVGEPELLMNVIQSNDARLIESEIHNGMEKYINFFNWQGIYDAFIYSLMLNKYHRISPTIIKAIIQTESSFDPKAIRPEPRISDSSIGLMQILIKTAKQVAPFTELSNDQIKLALFHPYLNIVIGTKYFAGQFERYNSNYEKTIAAYNAGSAIISKTTKDFINRPYVDKVLSYAQFFNNDFPLENPHT